MSMTSLESSSHCWLIDLTSHSSEKASHLGEVVRQTLKCYFPQPDSVGFIPATYADPSIENGKPTAGRIEWLYNDADDPSPLDQCVRELANPHAPACKLLVAILPQQLLGEFKSLIDRSLIDRSSIDQAAIFNCINAFSMVSELIPPELVVDHVEMVRSSFVKGKKNFSNVQINLLQLVRLACMAGHRGNAVFFVGGELDTKSTEHNTDWPFKVETYTDSDRCHHLIDPENPDNFRSEDGYDWVRQYLLSCLGCDLFGFHTRSGDSQTPFTLSTKRRVTSTWTDLSKRPYQDNYQHWYRQEFGSRKIGTLFTNAAWDAFCCSSQPRRHGRTLLPIEIQHSIGVARLSRRLATWTLEGNPFNCRVALLSGAAMDALGDANPRLLRLINLQEPTPFNLQNQDAVRRHAELAQSEGLYLIVCARDGLLHCIGTALEKRNAPARDVRHMFFEWLSGDDSLIFDIQPPGRVNLYGQRQLLLEYDGFEWIQSPTPWLGKRFVQFFSFDKNKVNKRAVNQSSQQILAQPSPGNASRCSETLSDAIRQLLQAHDASIFALLDDRDLSSIDSSASELLRPDIQWSSRGHVDIDGLDPESLAGLLHLDGAHLINRAGKVISISRKISVRPYRDEIRLDSVEQKIRLKEWLMNEDKFPVNTDKPVGIAYSKIPAGDYGIDFTLRIFRRLRARELHKWLQEKINGKSVFGSDLKKDLIKILDRDAPWMIVLRVDGLCERLCDEIHSDLQNHFDKLFLKYRSHGFPSTKQTSSPNVVPALLASGYGTFPTDHESFNPEKQFADVFGTSSACLSSFMEEIRKVPPDTSLGKFISKDNSGEEDFKKRLKVIRIHKQHFPFNQAELSRVRSWSSGFVWDQNEQTLYAEECCIDARIDRYHFPTDQEGQFIPDIVAQRLLFWRQFGTRRGSQSPGTGSRAAKELSLIIPHSLVIKVSASGGFKLFQAGNTVALD